MLFRSNYVSYANGNIKSLPFVNDEIKNDPSVYPTPEVMTKLYAHQAESQNYSRDLNRAWTRVRTGQ